LRRHGVEPHRQSVELRLPVAAVAVEPKRGPEDRAGIEPTAADPTRALLGDEPGAHQDLYVARHRLQRDVERLGKLGDQTIPAVEPGQDRSPHRVRQRAEYQVQCLVVGLRLFHAWILLNRRDYNQR
jgi:hypothetical protein